MDLTNNEEILKRVTENLNNYFLVYKQYCHRGKCVKGPCNESSGKAKKACCEPFIHCIHASNKLHDLPKHPNCDCYYVDLDRMELGTVSQRKPSPDVWLKLFGKLPDYYITKKEARALGWEPGKDLSKLAPGKMIGGDVYYNKDYVLPEEEGRVWFECDIDYVSGKRNSLRMYYSNDGLMFYSPDHLYGEVTVFWIK